MPASCVRLETLELAIGAAAGTTPPCAGSGRARPRSRGRACPRPRGAAIRSSCAVRASVRRGCAGCTEPVAASSSSRVRSAQPTAPSASKRASACSRCTTPSAERPARRRRSPQQSSTRACSSRCGTSSSRTSAAAKAASILPRERRARARARASPAAGSSAADLDSGGGLADQGLCVALPADADVGLRELERDQVVPRPATGQLRVSSGLSRAPRSPPRTGRSARQAKPASDDAVELA